MLIAQSSDESVEALIPIQAALTLNALKAIPNNVGSDISDISDTDEYSPGSKTSIASSIVVSSPVSSPRESHNDLNSPYCLPADGLEKLRLNSQHEFIRDHVCGGRLVSVDNLMLEEGDIVLDLGTGSGAWASDLAQHLPGGVHIHGFDICSRLFPPDSHNVTFAVGNVLQLPVQLESRVTLAHQRLLIYALRIHEWSTALASIKNALIPGKGIIQLTEVFTPPGNPGVAQAKFQRMLSSLGRTRQLLLDCSDKLPALLHTAGYVDVVKKTVRVRLGSEGGEEGTKAAACRIGAFHGMRNSVLSDGGYGVINSAEEFDELINNLAAEWETNECYAVYCTITARRPASGFTAPPSSLSIPEIFNFHAQHNGHLPFYRYFENDAIQHISYTALAAAVERAAKIVLVAANEGGDAPVAVLAVSDSITFITTMLGFLRAGVKAFFISPRNSAAATSHLLQKTSSQCILVSADEGMQRLAEAAIEQDRLTVSIKPMPTYEQLFMVPEEPSVPLLDIYDMDSVALILHSSGSTGFPKPIPLTHCNLVEWGRGAHGERNFEGEVLGGHSLAFFHAMGVIAPLWCACSGMQLAVFPPVSPPIRPTPESVYKGVVASQSTYIFCVPSHIEHWAVMPETHEHLVKQIKALAYCGAPLGADAGNLLSSKGVNLQPYFASTETGGMSLFLPEDRSSPRNRGWARFRIAPHCNMRVVPRTQDSGEEEGLAELVFLKGPHHTPSVFNATFEGEPAYTTGDLVVPEEIDGVQYFRFYGREDDQLLLSTGEKTNPVPIEKELLQDKNIDFVILFGDGKQQNGALIQPSASYRALEAADGPLSHDEKLARFRLAIAPTLAKANGLAPSHSFIFPELVLIADHPFQLTGKGTVRRRHTLKEFHDQIEQAYIEVERSTLPELCGPAAGAWTINNTLDFVSTVVRKVIGPGLPLNEDIFDHGADSLQATWIRNTILRVLREAGFKTRHIPSDLVFQFPNIQQLTAFLFGFSLSFIGSASSPSSEKLEEDEEKQTIVWPETGRVGESIVKLREGENPLIIIHGVGGSIHAFPPLQEKFRSGLWAIQVTPDTPLDGMENMVAFYHAAIKREQPHGPYRLAGFSATSIIAVALAKRLEEEGSIVAQLAMLDHVPGFYACPIYGILKGMLTDSEQLYDFQRICCEGVCDMMRRDGGGRVKRRHQLAQEISDAFAGKPDVPEFAATFWRTAAQFLNLMLEFLLREDLPGVTATTDSPAMFSFMEWQRRVKAPVSVYISTDGMIKNIPDSLQTEWADLGAKRTWPDAKIYNISGGHMDILGNDKLIDLLENDFVI